MGIERTFLRRRLLCASAMSLIACLPGAAMAQQATAVAAPAPTSASIGPDQSEAQTVATGPGDIVVTARRRAESLQSVPVNVTALGSESIEKLGIRTLFDLSQATPGFTYANTGQRTGNRVTTRGLGVSTTGASKTSFFLDGVYIAGDYTGLALSALDRVEVLKGPQSALFGRASFAGAVNYVTREPTNAVSGAASMEVASFGEFRVDANFSAPIIADKLYALVALNYYDFDAPDEWRDVDGTRHGSQSSRGAMGKLVFRPSADFKITAFGSYNRNDDGPGTALFIDPALRNGTITKINPLTGIPTGVVARYPFGRVPTFSPQLGNYNYFQRYLTNPGDRIRQWRSYLQAEAGIADHTLTVTGAYNDQHSESQSNLFLRARPPVGTVSNGLAYSEIIDKSVEARLQSPQNQWFRYALGLYYLDIKVNNLPSTLTYSVGPAVANDLVSVGAFGTNQNTNKSVFGALYIDPFDKLTVSLEGRYQWEDVKRTGATASFITLAAFNAGGKSVLTPILAPGGAQYDTTFKAFLPRVNLQYKFSPDFNVYATYSKGNNPGGFNTSQFASVDQRLIREENLYNYEIGLKARPFRSLTINLAAYWMDWKDQQTTGTFFTSATAVPPNTAYAIVENRGSSRIKGVDAEIDWRTPIDGLSFRLAGAYNDGRYRNYCSTNYAALLYTLPATATPAQRIQFACVPVDGNSLESVSKWTASASADYVRPLFDGWDGFVRGDYQYASRQWDSELNFAQAGEAHIVNLRAGIQRDHLTVEVYGRNLTNNATPTRLTRASDPFAGANNQTNQSIGFTPRLPRSIGLRVAVKL